MIKEKKTASGSPTIPATVTGGSNPPHTYLGVARAMMPGAIFLATKPEVSPRAFALVSAHVLECLLKAYLTRSGSDQANKAVTKPNIRHDLEKLWSKASGEGLAVDTAPPCLVTRLNETHASPYRLRYSTGVNGIVLPSTELTLNGLVEVSKLVDSSM